MAKLKYPPNLDLFPDTAGALFSPCRIWRYTLWRVWDASLPAGNVNWLMLNPSTADEFVLDPTLTRCQNFSREWGYGGMVVTNLFAFRATDPMVIKEPPEPVGSENDRAIVESATEAGLVVCGWGNHGAHLGREQKVLKLLSRAGIQLHCLKKNADGSPGHPLYLPGDSRPTPFPSNGRD